METPQTPRRSNRQQKLPARYGGGILISTSQTYKWPANPLHTRPTQPADFLPGETVGPGETHFYSSLIRYGPPSKPIIRAYGKQKSTKPTASGSKASETFSVGDTVLVVSTTKMPSVAVITALWSVARDDDEAGDDEDPSESMRIQVHWFVRPQQLGNTRWQRDTLSNEIYYSLANTAILSPQEVMRKCHITGRVPGSRPLASPWPITSRRAAEDEDIPEADQFVCRSAVDTQRGLFYEFSWEAHQGHAKAGPPGGWSRWAVPIAKRQEADTDAESDSDSPPPSPSKRPKPARKVPTKERPRPRKKARTKANLGDEEFEPEPLGSSSSSRSPERLSDASDADPDTVVEPGGSDLDLHDDVMKTPSKRKRVRASATTTPRHKRVNNLAAPTPHSKAALRARRKKAPLNVRPPPPEMNDEHYERLREVGQDPWLRAMHVLHVGARPNELPCRENEYSKALGSVLGLVEEGSSGCVYISGVPGTGKTATVHAVVRELKRMAESNESNPFTYVEINGLKIPEPHAAYNILWEAISGHDVAADGHLAVSWKEALKRLTKYFSGGTSVGPGGHTCVVLMDELDQLITAKQDVVYNFFNWPTYENSKLILLAVANTMNLPEQVLTSRVRSRLGLTRVDFEPYKAPQLQTIVQARLDMSRKGLRTGAAEVISKDGVKYAAIKVSSVSGDARRVLDICRRAVELVRPEKKTAGIGEVQEVISIMQNTPTAGYLRDLSLHERIMLAAVLRCVKKGGVEEVKWGDVQDQHLIYTNILVGDDDPTRRPTLAELGGVLDSLIASRAMLIEDGMAAQRKQAGERRVILNLEPNEVERVLSEVGGQMWKQVLGVS